MGYISKCNPDFQSPFSLMNHKRNHITLSLRKILAYFKGIHISEYKSALEGFLSEYTSNSGVPA